MALSTTPSPSRGQLIPAGSVQAGDAIAVDGEFVQVTTVQRARGRKPKVGENLYLVTGRGQVKVNSTAGVRVRR
jgi:hypothetical protein